MSLYNSCIRSFIACLTKQLKEVPSDNQKAGKKNDVKLPIEKAPWILYYEGW